MVTPSAGSFRSASRSGPLTPYIGRRRAENYPVSIIRRIFGLQDKVHQSCPTDQDPISQLDELVRQIAESRTRLLEIAARVASGRGTPGDETRLRIQREILEGYQKRLTSITVPTGTADDAEAWLRSVTPRTAT